MRITVNPTTQPSGEFGYTAAGRYRLRIKGVEQKAKEYPYLAWEVEFADPNVKAVEPEKKLGTIFENTTLKPAAQFRLRDLCDALGVTWGDFDTESLIGHEFEAQVVVDEYQGTLSNKIKKFFPKK